MTACATCTKKEERSCPNRRCSCGMDWDDACPRSPVYGADGRCPHCGLRPTIACTCWACGATWTTKAGPTQCARCGSLYLTAIPSPP